MNFPKDGVMLVLLALDVGEKLEVSQGELLLTMPEFTSGPVVVPLTALDDLENRGWLEIVENGPVVTTAGSYWLRRWLSQKYGKGRFRRSA